MRSSTLLLGQSGLAALGLAVRPVVLWLTLLGCFLGVTPQEAHADLTYDYSGLPLSALSVNANGAVTISTIPGITGSATFDISPGFNGEVFADSTTLNAAGFSGNCTSPFECGLYFFQNGQITEWSTGVFGPIGQAGYFNIQTENQLLRCIVPVCNTDDQITDTNSVGVVLASNGTPGTWAGATPPPPSPSLYLTVTTLASNFSLSAPAQPLGITASLTLGKAPPPSSGTVVLSVPLSLTVPSGATTLQQVANDLGYQGFDWVQDFSGPSPLPYYRCEDASCDSVQEIVASSSDPAQPYGWDYCNPSSPSFVRNSVYGNSCVSPYYYNPAIATNPTLSSSTDPSIGGCVYTYNGMCVPLTNAGDTSFNFYDAPADPCLTTNGVTPAYDDTLSNGQTVASLCDNLTASGALTFDTELVGIPLDGGSPVPIAGFDWLDTFNGLLLPNNMVSGYGGIITPETDLTPDPQTGTGGITITEINGQPVSTVPEPPTFILLLSFFVLLGIFRRRPFFYRYLIYSTSYKDHSSRRNYH